MIDAISRNPADASKIVFDVGTCNIRAGFAGQVTPKAVVPSVVLT